MKHTYVCKKSGIFVFRDTFDFVSKTYTSRVGETARTNEDNTRIKFEGKPEGFLITPEQLEEYFEPYITKEEEAYLKDMRNKCIVAALQGLVTVESDSNVIAARVIECANAVVEQLKEEMI